MEVAISRAFRRVQSLTLTMGLLLPRVAFAWPFEALPATDLPDDVTGIAVVERDGQAELIALSHTLGWMLDPASGSVKRLLASGGTDAVAFDIDHDGDRELLVCHSEGLEALRWEGERWPMSPVRVLSEPCDAIAATRVGGDPRVGVIVGEELRVLRPPNTARDRALVPVAEVALPGLTGDSPHSGAPLLSAWSGRFAASRVGASQIVEWSPNGLSTIATGGPIGGLAQGPGGWTWSLPERSAVTDLSHTLLAVSAGPGMLASAQLDDDGALDLLTLHDGVPGVVGSALRAEIMQSELAGTTQIVGADVDGDGCGDLVRAQRSPGQVAVHRSVACLGVARVTAAHEPTHTSRIPLRPGSDDTVRFTPPPDPLADFAPGGVARMPSESDLPPPATVPHALGVDFAPFLGGGALTEEERLRRQRYVLLGTGWVVGSTLDRPLLRIPVFPALSIEYEVGGPHARWFIGGDSAGLFFWLVDRGTEDNPDVRGGIHLANLSAGATFGSPRLRAGPFVTAGIWNAGVGLRAVATPWPESRYERRGVEARLTYFAPGTGEVMVLYVWNEPLRKPSAMPADHAFRDIPDAYAGKDLPSGIAVCHRFNLGLGVTVGGSSTRHSWQYVGRDVAVEVRGSPALAVSCDTGEKHTGMLLSMETAPVFSYLTTGDQRRFHLGSATVGWMVGGRKWRVGPTATAGIWALGGGVRGVSDIFTDKQGLHHRIEMRAQVLTLAAPAAEAWLLYNVSFDPRK